MRMSSINTLTQVFPSVSSVNSMVKPAFPGSQLHVLHGEAVLALHILDTPSPHFGHTLSGTDLHHWGHWEHREQPVFTMKSMKLMKVIHVSLHERGHGRIHAMTRFSLSVLCELCGKTCITMVKLPPVTSYIL